MGLSACSGTAAAAALSPEQSALTALGFTSADVTPVSGTANADPAVAPSASTKHPRLKKLAIRRLALRKNVEHGQVTVETKNGDETIDVQRGTVTAISSTSMTVKSTDGYSLTWTISSPLNVIEHRTKVQPSAVTTGETVGVAGLQSGSAATAKLVVIPDAKTPAPAPSAS